MHGDWPGAGGDALAHSDDPLGLRGDQLRHDLCNMVATINLLAAGITRNGEDEFRGGGLQQMTAELQRLTMLLDSSSQQDVPRPTRVDLVIGELLATLRLTTTARLECVADEAWVDVAPLQLWRAVRNLVDNALRAAGANGHVQVGVSEHDVWTLVEVEDDGPGFAAGPAGRDSLGLSIVRSFAERYQGSLTIERSRMGGCAVRIWLPSSRTGACRRRDRPVPGRSRRGA